MRNVSVTYHHEDGSWWAESADVEGFTALGSTFAEVHQLVLEGLDFYLDGESVHVIERLEDGSLLTTVGIAPLAPVAEVRVDVARGWALGLRDPQLFARQAGNLLPA